MLRCERREVFVSALGGGGCERVGWVGGVLCYDVLGRTVNRCPS